jgi:TonB family protein
MVMLFRCASLALLAISASAQAEDEARKLIQDVETAARATRVWRAEGVQTTDDDMGPRFRRHYETRFGYDIDGARAHLTTAGDSGAETVVCAEGAAWVHYGRAEAYTKTPTEFAGGVCAPQLLPWQMLSNRLVSARNAGDGEDCRMVRAEYEPLPGAAGPEVRTFCIDPVAKVVRSERFESQNPNSHLIRTTTLSKYERDPQFAPDAFTFRPPPNTQLADNSDIRQLVSPGGPAQRVGRGVTAPQLVSRAQPEYTEEARKAKYNATVMMLIVVGTDGAPRDMKVIRAVGMGLDERAIEAVRGWRFRPGARNGEPVPVYATIEVNFRIL